MAETFDSIWEYCQANKRICPMPQKWNELYSLLKYANQKPSGGWEPPLPLILAAWHDTTPIQKQFRFKEHIQWASDKNQINEIGSYLRNLQEDEWYHFGEL